jgi:glycerol kinase
MGDRLLVIDEGTTSTRAMLFAADGACLAVEQRPLTQNYPRPGWVEHDAEEIWTETLACARTMAGEAGRIAAIGITNQRETVVFWSRRTGRALAPAIVWQDRRTAAACEALKQAGHEAAVQAKTGLLLDPYFSASKIAWALEHWPQLKEAGDDLCVGTVESWLVFRLTGGLHVSDATNASRTALMDIRAGGWDDELLALWNVPRRALPEIVDCARGIGETRPEHLGRPIAICGLAGDQQAAAIGQACLSPGDTKATYGTGAFVLTDTGEEMRTSRNRLLSTIARQIGGRRSYALEGSLFVAGSLIKWLRDSLGLIGTAEESETLARSIEHNGGVHIVPAHGGLGAPHWRPEARGLISGLTLGTGRAEIARAALEAMAHQTHDLMEAFAADGAPWSLLRIDGGMAANDWLAQDLADVLGLSVERPDNVETTALGAAMLAGVGCGMFADLKAAAEMRGAVRRFEPTMPPETREGRLDGWRRALAAALR